MPVLVNTIVRAFWIKNHKDINMSKPKVVPENPKEHLRKHGYTSYVDFARKHKFDAGNVRKSLKRYELRTYLPRVGSSARKIIVTFFKVTGA